MIIMGIDPGTIKAGYGVIRAEGSEIKAIDYGLAKGGSRSRKDYGKRLRKIYSELQKIIDTHKPDQIYIESVFFHKNVKSAIKIGEGRGVAILAASFGNVEVGELSPKVIKKAVTGRGDASKQQVADMVKLILGLSEIPSPDDVTDALAIAIAGSHRKQLDILKEN